jgi:hypothetical protein
MKLRNLVLIAVIVLSLLITASAFAQSTLPPCELFPDGTQPACIYVHLAPGETLIGDMSFKDLIIGPDEQPIAPAVHGWRSSYNPVATGHTVTYYFRNIKDTADPNVGVLYIYPDVSKIVTIPAARPETYDIPVTVTKKYIRGTLIVTCNIQTYTNENVNCGVSIDGVAQAVPLAPGQKGTYILDPGSHKVDVTLGGTQANLWSPATVSQTAYIYASATPRGVTATFLKAAQVTIAMNQPNVTADLYVDGFLVATQVPTYQLYLAPNKSHKLEAKNIVDTTANGVYTWRDGVAYGYYYPGTVKTTTISLTKQYLKGFVKITCVISNAATAPGAYCQPTIDGVDAQQIASGSSAQFTLDPGAHKVNVIVGPAAQWTTPKPVATTAYVYAGNTATVSAYLTAEAIPLPIEFSGTGQVVTDSINVPFAPARAIFTHQGSSNFIVWAHDSAGDRDLLVNIIGSYFGSNYLEGKKSYVFEIKADGAWTARIELPGRNDAINQGITGHGDTVTDLFMPTYTGSVAYRFTHNGSRNFIVWLRCGTYRDLVQNEIGPVTNEAIAYVTGGPCLWEITADGDWSITPK